MAHKSPTIRTRDMSSGCCGWGGVFHAGKLVVLGRVTGGWVGDAAAPLEDEGEGGESEGEKSEEEEEFGGE